MKKIGEKDLVIVNKKGKGQFVKKVMTLEEIKEHKYKGHTIYIYSDEIEKFVSYDYKVIDLNFLNEINIKFLGTSIF